MSDPRYSKSIQAMVTEAQKRLNGRKLETVVTEHDAFIEIIKQTLTGFAEITTNLQKRVHNLEEKVRQLNERG